MQRRPSQTMKVPAHTQVHFRGPNLSTRKPWMMQHTQALGSPRSGGVFAQGRATHDDRNEDEARSCNG